EPVTGGRSPDGCGRRCPNRSRLDRPGCWGIRRYGKALTARPFSIPPTGIGLRGARPARVRAPLARKTSGQRAELDVDRRGSLDERAELHPPVRELDAKDGDAVGVLVGGIEE